MGDLGLPGSVVEMPDEAPQKALWEVRKAGLNIMMSMKGDGKPVSLHRGLRGAARAPGRLHRRADRGVRAPRHARHLVRARVGRHAARAADPRHAPRRRRQDARDRRGGGGAGARVQGRVLAASTATGWCRGEWVALAVRAAPRPRRSRRSRTCFDPTACSTPARSSTRRRWTTASLFRFTPGYRHDRAASRRSTGRRGTCRTIRSPRRTTAPGTGGDPTRRLRQGRRDVQQQRPLPQVRRRHDVPELPRHARRAAPDARPRQHAAAGAVGPARTRDALTVATRSREALDLCVGCKGCRRECPTGVDMAR